MIYNSIKMLEFYSFSVASLVQIPNLDGSVLRTSHQTLGYKAEFTSIDCFFVSWESVHLAHSLQLPKHCLVLGGGCRKILIVHRYRDISNGFGETSESLDFLASVGAPHFYK